MYIIVGLGNPGFKYKYTRHNAGYMALDCLAEDLGVRFRKKQFSGVTAEAFLEGEKLLLLKPETFMNLSGLAVAEALDYFSLPTDRLIVVYDDVDLAPGKLRIRGAGSAGTHNGMRNIVARIRSTEFPRVRIGIGKAPAPLPLADYVLEKLKGEDRKQMLDAAQRAAGATQEILRAGIASAQQKFQ